MFPCGAFVREQANAVEVRLKTLKNILISLALIAAGTASAQTVSVSPTTLSFSGLVGGPAVSQTLNITATGSNTSVLVTPSQSWLTVSQSSGTTPLQVTVSANPAGLSSGTYSDANFRVTTPTQTITVPVSFTVGPISVTPNALNFSYTQFSPVNPPGQTLTVNGQNLNFNVATSTTDGAAWLSAAPVGNQINVALNGIVLIQMATGTYHGAITVTQSGSTPVTIPVTLTVSPEPPVTISPATVNLNYQIGGLNNQGSQQAVTFATTSTVPLPFVFGQPTVQPNPAGATWFQASPTNGTIPAGGSAQSTISYLTSVTLPAGTYSGSIPVAATGGAVSESPLPVNLLVSNNPLLIVPTQALSFSYEINGAAPAAQSVTPQSTAVVASSTTGQMPINVLAITNSGGPWLSVTPTAGLNTGTPFSVSVNPANLLPGVYTGTVTVSPAAGATAGNGPQQITVTLTVANDPSIIANTSVISIPYQVGQTAPGAQTVSLTSSTGAPLTYTVTSVETACATVNWLTLGGATSGNTDNSFTVSVTNLASISPGTCAGTVTVTATNPATGNAALNSPLTIPVVLFVSNSPLLVVSPASLSFSSPVGGSGGTQSIQVTSTDPNSNLPYSVTFTTNSGGNWLAVGPQSGSTASNSNVINVSVVPTLLSSGTYKGSITLTSPGVANSGFVVPVTLQVTSGGLNLSSNSLSFSFTAGGANPAAQTVQVGSSGGLLNFTAAANSGNATTNWLSVTPTSGSTPAALSISATPGNLPVGTYNGTVVVTAPNAANSPATIAVTLSVNSGTITATPAPTAAGLTFTQPQGGLAPAAQTIALASTPGAVNFTTAFSIQTGGNWLTVTPSSGTTPGTVSISANAGSLPVGTYTGQVVISAPGASGAPFTYPITLNVVTPITIVASPATLNFGYTLQTAAPAAQTVQITATAPAGVGTLAQFPFGTTVTTTDGGKWLTVTPTTGTVPGSVSVAVNPTGLVAGNYTGTISIASSNGNGASPATVTVKLAVTTAPTPIVQAVTNAASGSAGAISPGEEVAIYGTNFGPPSVVSATLTNNSFPTTLANTQVLFDGVPAPIIAVIAGQVNVMVPYGIAGRATTNVVVSYLGVPSAGLNYNVTTTVPGIYTVNQAGTGQGAILNQDFSINGPTNAAARGTVIAIYMTGEGVTSPPSVTGQLAPLDGTGLNKPVQTVTATVGGVNAPVQYYGSAPGLVYGVMQVNVLVPTTISTGNQPVVVTVGSANSQGAVTASIK
jgi:uncharacterized protein (TIGR03437 family)